MSIWQCARHKINLYHRHYYWHREGVIFVHVPKAAGTSINKALYGRTLGHYTAAEIKAKFPRLYDRSFVFSVVRNPWDRLLSAYRFAKIGRTGSMAISNFRKYQIPEFESFERFVWEWLVFQDFKTIDFVFKPQSWFVCHPNESRNIVVDYLAKVETLQTDIEEIGAALGRKVSLERLNVTQQVHLDYREAYKSSEMVDITHSIYGEDIDTFGYRFE